MAVSVVTIDDTVAAEGSETYNVTLTALTNVAVGDVSGLGTINDNESIFIDRIADRTALLAGLLAGL